MRAAIGLAIVVSLLGPAGLSAADLPTIVEVTADPPAIRLSGPGSRYSLLVTGAGADAHQFDLTSDCRYQVADPAICEVSAAGQVLSRRVGSTRLEVEVAGRKLTVPVEVGSAPPHQVSFENDVCPLLTKFGCNSSGCHGKAEGQNGFKLSVFGFDPQADYDALTKEGRGRRVSVAVPSQSLLLAKVSGQLPHGGGVRIKQGTPEFQTLASWIAAGLPRPVDDEPKVVGIKLAPRERLLGLGARQRLRVVASYSDGREIDVTGLTKFQSNHDGLATVDDGGLITVGQTPGQVAIMATFMGAVDVFRAIVPRAEPVADYPSLPESSVIDQLVYRKLRQLNIVPAEVADDAEYLRRVSLDLIGTLPTAAEARKFLADERPDRRARVVDELLVRPEFADYWALKWADLLRVDRQTLGHKGAYSYYQWIRQSIAANKPMDQFAREIITAEGPLVEAPAGYLYKAVPKPGNLASTVSQVFLGIRLACAECHHHPSDRWSQTDYYGMQAFFTQVSSKVTPLGDAVCANGDPKTQHPRTGEAIVAHGLGTTMPESLPPLDRRPILAGWLTSPDNPWFARNLANRMWAHLLGRGLVEPVDDVRATNPPTNPELLDALAKNLVENKFDMRALIRAITTSRVYQHSSRPNETNERDEQNYSRALFKRIDAEVLFDAVCQTTGRGEKFRGLPSGYRAIQLWDSKVPHYFLRLFGRPSRESVCECDRNVEPSVAQVLHFLNSPEIYDKLRHDGGRVAQLTTDITENAKLVDELYLTFYSRHPNDQERQVGVDYLQAASQRRQGAEDLAWSLMNSLEFVFNH